VDTSVFPDDNRNPSLVRTIATSTGPNSRCTALIQTLAILVRSDQ